MRTQNEPVFKYPAVCLSLFLNLDSSNKVLIQCFSSFFYPVSLLNLFPSHGP